MVFVDTSAFYALLAANDPNHARATAYFAGLLEERQRLLTSSFVLHETLTLLQRRIGLGPVAALHRTIRPVLEILWLDQEQVDRAIDWLLELQRRNLSLTDLTSFIGMQDQGMTRAFAFDEDFRRFGFQTLPD